MVVDSSISAFVVNDLSPSTKRTPGMLRFRLSSHLSTYLQPYPQVRGVHKRLSPGQ